MSTTNDRRRGTLLQLVAVLAIVALVGCSSTHDAASSLAPRNERLRYRPGRHDPVPTVGAPRTGTVPAMGLGFVLDRLDRALPTATVGGSWVVESDGQRARVVVESTADAAGRRDLQSTAELMVPGWITITPGPRTRAQLLALIDRVAARMGRGSPITGVGQAVRDGRTTLGSHTVILVDVDADALTDELVDDLARIVPRDVLQVRAKERPTSD